MSSSLAPEVVFEATPRQAAFAEAVFSGHYRILAFGGGIRSGKTYILLALLFALCRIYPKSRWAIVRKDLPTLRRNTIPSFAKLRPRFVGPINQGTWTATCDNGSEILFFSESLDVDPDLDRWKGLEVNGFALEEANELDKRSYTKAIERAGSWIIPDAPVQPDPLVLLTFNPAPNWVKRTFYDPWKANALPAGYFYQPATVADNPHIPESYVAALSNLPEQEYKRFVAGDWESMSGAALPELGPDHFVRPFPVPSDWLRFLAFDWGWNHPFSVGLYAANAQGHVFKLDTLTGRKLDDPAILGYVRESLTARGYAFSDFQYTVAGGDVWNDQHLKNGITGPSSAETFTLGGWPMIRADNRPGSRVAGLSNLRRYLKGGKDARLKFFDTPGNRACVAQMQGMMLDPDKPEDALKVDADENGEGGDDCYDETRYALMSRPIAAALEPPAPRKHEDKARPYDFERKQWVPEPDAEDVLVPEPGGRKHTRPMTFSYRQ